MKKLINAVSFLSLMGLPFCINAQEATTEKKEVEIATEKNVTPKIKETEEIVIRNKGGKDINLKVEINGDKITVNGKPLEDFKDTEVTIDKRKMIIRQGGKSLAFTIPPNLYPVQEDFMNGWNNEQEVIKPFLGVTTEKTSEGAKITEVIKASAGEKAGLKKDDIITKVGDEKIEDGESLSAAISSKKPKDIVKITYLRNGKSGSVKATLGERKSIDALAFNYARPRVNVRKFATPGMPGVKGDDMINQERIFDMESLAPGAGFNTSPFIQLEKSFPRQKKLGLKIQDTEEGGNVKVIEVEEGSAAEKAGLKKDDFITAIGGVKIENTDDAREQLMLSASKATYPIKAKRGNKEMDFEIKIPKKLKTADL
jgi:serine protease Do